MAYAMGYKVFVTYQQLLNAVIYLFIYKVVVLIILIIRIIIKDYESAWFQKNYKTSTRIIKFNFSIFNK